MDKLKILFSVLAAGQEVAEPERLKANSIRAGYVATVVTAGLGLAHSFGLLQNVSVDADTINNTLTYLFSAYALIQALATAASSARASANPFTSSEQVKSINREIQSRSMAADK